MPVLGTLSQIIIFSLVVSGRTVEIDMSFWGCF